MMPSPLQVWWTINADVFGQTNLFTTCYEYMKNNIKCAAREAATMPNKQLDCHGNCFEHAFMKQWHSAQNWKQNLSDLKLLCSFRFLGRPPCTLWGIICRPLHVRLNAKSGQVGSNMALCESSRAEYGKLDMNLGDAFWISLWTLNAIFARIAELQKKSNTPRLLLGDRHVWSYVRGSQLQDGVFQVILDRCLQISLSH